jgi:Histidine kinase-, DNA gyrase B-, and HSP90-like ATPase.
MIFINEKAIEITIGIIISFLDYAMVYYLCHNFIDKKIILSRKLILLGITFATLSGVISNIVGGYVYRIFSIIIIIVISKLISKRKYYNVLILFTLILATMMIIQIVILLILRILSIDSSNLFIFSLLGQILTLVSVMFLCVKVPLYKVLDIIERKVLIKFLIILVTTIFLVLFTILDFDIENITLSILCLLILTSIIFNSLHKSLKDLFEITSTVPMQLHDTKNLFISMCISAETIQDIEYIRKDLRECMDIMQIDSFIDEIKVNDYKQNILQFINYKIKKNTKKLIFLADVYYDEPTDNVSYSVAIYMLGTLLDNAIETGTKEPIYIYMYGTKNKLEISVSNEYERKNTDDFDKMFQIGHSTKLKNESDVRGYGLPNLSESVKRYGGEIIIEYSYNKEQKKNYLTISLKIGNGF